MARKQAAPKGTYSSGLVGVDYEILRQLPDEGAKTGYHDIGATPRAIAKKLEGMPVTLVQGRLQALKVLGYVVNVQLLPVSQGKGWQITKAGKTLLEGKEKQNG